MRPRPARPGPLLLLVTLLTGCSGEKGATLVGTLVEDGQPVQVAEKEIVLLSVTPTDSDEKSLKASPGAEFKRDDASFRFVGPGKGLVPPGSYKVSLTIRPREGTDRFGGIFSGDASPLTYTVTAESIQEIIIDVKKKTITRK